MPLPLDDAADRPATKPTDEIEITPEMIEAGACEFLAFAADGENGTGDANEAVRYIFTAMIQVARRSSSIVQ
jgi:hypothetical protein